MGSFKTLEAFFKPVPKAAQTPTTQGNTGIAAVRDQHNLNDSADCTGADTVPPPQQLPSRPKAQPQPSPSADTEPETVTSKEDILSVMLHGRRPAPGTEVAPRSAATSAPSRMPASTAPTVSKRPLDNLCIVPPTERPSAQLQRPPKRPCLEATPSRSPPTQEPFTNLASLLAARSCGRLAPRSALWWSGDTRLMQIGCWDAALRERATSVLQQDAVTQIELSGPHGDPTARLAVAQANQLVRVVPAGVLRQAAEARRAAEREAAPDSDVDSDTEDEHDDAERSEEAGGCTGGKGPQWGGHVDGAVSCAELRRRRGQWRRRAAALLPPLPLSWEDLRCHCAASRTATSRPWPSGAGQVAGGIGGDGGGYGGYGGGGSSVVTIRTHQTVAALGWDPRRLGRLAIVDRSSSNVMILDLGASCSGGDGSAGANYRRSVLTAAPAASIGGGGAAARALTFLKYGSPSLPYSLAAASRASGEGAVVHLWDERRGPTPVSRLTPPGGAPLVAPLETALDGTALLGVVHPGTLVVWDVRRAASNVNAGALFSLGASAPNPTAVLASCNLLGPLASAGCWRPVISSLASDPQDSSRVALLTQDGSSALWSLATARLTHACPEAPPPTALPTGPVRAVPLDPGSSTFTLASSLAAAAAAGVSQPGRRSTALMPPLPGAMLGPTGRPASVPGAAPGYGRGLVGSVHSSAPIAATSVCALAGSLSGAWDADVCGFWHPASVSRGGAAAGAGAGDSDTCPGLVLADFRNSAASLGSGRREGDVAGAQMTSAAFTAGVRSSAEGGTSSSGGGGIQGARGIAGGGAGVQGTPGSVGVQWALGGRRAVAVATSEWPMCMAVLPETGDLVVGTLGGRLSYWSKAR